MKAMGDRPDCCAKRHGVPRALRATARWVPGICCAEFAYGMMVMRFGGAALLSPSISHAAGIRCLPLI